MEHSKKFKIFSKKVNHFNTINLLDENTIFNDNVLTVFHHSHYDYLDNSAISFSNSLFNKNWDYLRNNNNAVLIFSNHKEITNINYLANEINKIVNVNLIPANKIYIILYDELHQNYLEEKLKEYSIENVNIDVYNYWLPCIWDYEEITSTKNVSKKRFSVLCRSHKKDRIDFYVDLINNDILENCLFTYKGTNSIIWNSYHTPDEILNELYEPSEKVKQWLKDFPYELDAGRFHDSSYLIAKDIIEDSDINIVLETHCDPFGNEFALVTEKTYKAIFFKKPFIVYGEPFHLDSLKKLGYMTFDGIIDESYDRELDKIKRKKMVIEQLIKIKNLNGNDFQSLLKQCEKIVQHNYDILKNKVFLQYWSKKFKDLKIFANKFGRGDIIFYGNYKIFTKLNNSTEYQVTLYKNIDNPKLKISKISIKEFFTPLVNLKIFWTIVLIIWLMYFLQLRII